MTNKTKSYMHIRLAIVETQYHNLNDNIKSQEHWPPSVRIKIQKALNCSTGLKPQGYFPTFWPLPFCSLVYTIKFHLMATF